MNLERIRADLNKFHLHLDDDATKWWESFLQNPDKVEEATPRWILPLLFKARAEEPQR